MFMKNYVKIILKNKWLWQQKDLLIFLGVLIVTFVSVLTIATIALEPDEGAGGIIDDNPKTPIDNPPTVIEELPKPKFGLPMKENYVISREFFDLESTNPGKIDAIVQDMKHLDDAQLDTIAALVKGLRKK